MLTLALVALAVLAARTTLTDRGGPPSAAPQPTRTSNSTTNTLEVEPAGPDLPPQQQHGPMSVRDARTALSHLRVLATRPDRAGYQRGCAPGQACSFGPAWTDDSAAPGGHNGCGTRDDVLRRSLTGAELRPGSRCIVESGDLADPYTGRTIHFQRGGTTSARVQIDHVVPLALAYDLGAWAWTPARRTAYANDESLVLLAVDGPANEQKSDSGPGEWMPPNKATWCAYASRFVAVLTHYQLAVTAADKTALATVLNHCPAV